MSNATNVNNRLWIFVALVLLGVLIAAGYFAFQYLSQSPSAAATQAFDTARLQYHANILRGHANELKNAVGRASDPAVRRHTEHLINVIVGKSSPDYGDLDRDGIVEDPGDGTGMLVYLQILRDQASAANETIAVQRIDRVRDILKQILASCKTILAANDFNDIYPQINDVQRLSDQLARGTSDSVPEISQLLRASSTQPGVNPEQPQAGTIAVDMQQFVFNPTQLKVKQGATVVFVNKDNAKHTVTADSGAWNSMDISAGKIFKYTFNQTGTFLYHCEYHGDVNGIDMAGTVIVTPE